MKKILLVSQYFYPENFRVNDIAFSLKKRGYDVDVLTGLPNYPKGKLYPGYHFFRKRKEIIQGVKIYRLPIFLRHQNPISLILNYVSFVIYGWFWKTLSSKKYDLVFSVEVSPMTQILPAIWIAKKQKIPVITYIQDIWPESIMMVKPDLRPLIKKRLYKLSRYIYNNVDHILVPSPATVSWIRKHNQDVRIDYWPQYSESFYKPLVFQKETKPFILMFTGNIGSSQGLDSILQAIGLIKDRITPSSFQFHLVGDGRDKDRLIAFSDSLGIQDFIQFIPAVEPEKIPEMLAKAHMGYLSFSDNPLFNAVIPAKLQSYLACGIPTLVFAKGESARIIEEAKAGIVVNPKTLDSLADQLLNLIGLDGKELNDWGQNARFYAEKHFDKEYLLDWFEETVLKGKNHDI